MLVRSPQGPSYRLVLLVAVAVFLGIGALALAAAESGQAAYPGPGARIAFVREDNQGAAIFSAAADGTDEVQLTSGYLDREPTFSADGRRIAFNRNGAIAVMKADGSKQQYLALGTESSSTATTVEEDVENPNTSEVIPFVRVEATTTTFSRYEHPSFSPDGTRIAVSRSSGHEVETFGCAVATEDGTTCIEEGEPEGYEYREVTCPDCVEQIVAIDSTTGAVASELTQPSSQHLDSEPSYAANGEITFDRTEPNTYQSGQSQTGEPVESSIYTLGTGGTETKVSNGPLDFSPDFSPDGSEIVCTQENHEELGFAAGGSVRSEAVLGGPGASLTEVEAPIFSPDGDSVLFGLKEEVGSQEYEYGVYSIPSGGGQQTLVVAGGQEPAWQPVVPAPEPETPETPVTPPSTTPGGSGSSTTQAPATPAPVPPKAPGRGATVHAKHGRVTLDGSDQATVGSVACGSSKCTIAPGSASLRVGPIMKPSSPEAIRCRATVVAPATLAAGKTGSVAVRVGNAGCLERLEARGTGKLRVAVRVSDAEGSRMLRTHLTLLPKS